MKDKTTSPDEIKHHYGPSVHLLQDATLSSWLTKLCQPATFQPQVNSLIEFIYGALIKTVMNCEFPRERVRVPTRMTAVHPESPFEGEVLADCRVVTVNLARAGTLPSQICYDFLNHLLDPQKIRQDHVLASRVTDLADRVTGTAFGGTKIGGDVESAIVIFPDPMGATGNTLVSAVDHYKKMVGGKAAKYIAVHLIVTPEYLKNVRARHPDLIVYAVRVDRGLSTREIQASAPGLHWDDERGLNDKQYIVPGAGGFGEIMNNSFV